MIPGGGGDSSGSTRFDLKPWSSSVPGRLTPGRRALQITSKKIGKRKKSIWKYFGGNFFRWGKSSQQKKFRIVLFNSAHGSRVPRGERDQEWETDQWMKDFDSEFASLVRNKNNEGNHCHGWLLHYIVRYSNVQPHVSQNQFLDTRNVRKKK